MEPGHAKFAHWPVLESESWKPISPIRGNRRGFRFPEPVAFRIAIILLQPRPVSGMYILRQTMWGRKRLQLLITSFSLINTFLLMPISIT